VPISDEMRRLQAKWKANRYWPQRVEWLAISGLRGWRGQQIKLDFPMVAISGENGAGKSTILQAIAALYLTPEEKRYNLYATKFFPASPWDNIQDATIQYAVRQGTAITQGVLRKPKDRWRETPDRLKRNVLYIDLKRIQALSSRTGYPRIAKALNKESRREQLPTDVLNQLTTVCGRPYDSAALALSIADESRWVPVASVRSQEYSGFHSGAGELALMELLSTNMPNYSAILIDEFETSLHPRAQRRLMQVMAHLCRTKELQIILTTHSPFVLDELPAEGRMYVMNQGNERTIITGVSPSFALTHMDDEAHPEIDVFVEDIEAKILLVEMIVAKKRDLVRCCDIIPYGAANVGFILGQMVHEQRFTRPTIVFLDGDQEAGRGYEILPGGDAPERVVFKDLKAIQWRGVADRVARGESETIDALNAAMTKADHHDWVADAADKLVVGRIELWRALSSLWVKLCAESKQIELIVQAIEDRIELPGRKARQPQSGPKDSSAALADAGIVESHLALPPQWPAEVASGVPATDVEGIGLSDQRELF
jgi:predicted ATPase